MPGPLGMMSRDTPSKSDVEWGYLWDIHNGSFPPTRDDEGLCESLTHPFNSCAPAVWRDDALGVWTQMGLNDSTIEALMKK
jgi:hypothetical protein